MAPNPLWLFANDGARRAYARRAIREAIDGTGRVSLSYGEPFQASEIDEVAACLVEAAWELDQELELREHPSGWMGVLTPAYGSAHGSP